VTFKKHPPVSISPSPSSALSVAGPISCSSGAMPQIAWSFAPKNGPFLVVFLREICREFHEDFLKVPLVNHHPTGEFG
jgi:hypothetical protein